MRISTFIVFGGNYAPSSADMLRRTLSSTASSSSWTCRLNSGVMEKDWYPGRDSHLSNPVEGFGVRGIGWQFLQEGNGIALRH